MKFIYNNTKYEIDIDDFISVYHLRTLIKKKYGFIIDESFSITDLEGIIYKADGTVIKNNDTIIIKKKLRGGQDFNPYDKDISERLKNSIIFITAIVSGLYYFKYVSGLILGGVDENEYLVFQKYKNIETYEKNQKGGINKNEGEINNNMKVVSDMKKIIKKYDPTIENSEIKKIFENSEIKEIFEISEHNKNDTTSSINLKIVNKLKEKLKNKFTSNQIDEILKKFQNIREEATIENSNPKPSIFKMLLKSFKESIQDSRFDKVNCAFDRLFPEKELNRDYDNISNWNMIFTSALFFTYFLTVLISLFIIPTSIQYCGIPNKSTWIQSLVMIFIPLALVYLIPYIVKAFDFLFVQIFHLASGPVFSNYKLAISNVILIVILILFLLSNIKAISPTFGIMIPIFIVVFSVMDFILKKTPKDKEEMFNLSLNKIKPSHRIKQNTNYPAPECYYRFNIFHSLLYGVVVSLIGGGFFSTVYGANIKHCCGK
jgi:hypothetical protein